MGSGRMQGGGAWPLPLLTKMATGVPRADEPLGSVDATDPGGHGDATAVRIWITLNPALRSLDRAVPTDAHVRPGMDTCVPNAIARFGFGNCTIGRPLSESRNVSATTVLIDGRGSVCRFVALSGSASTPATASCGVIAMSAYAWLLSVVPVLPAIGRRTVLPLTVVVTCPATARAVVPSHLPNADWLPIGQRAASSATFAISGSMTCEHCGLAISSWVPFGSVIDLTGSGVHRMPLLAIVPYADAI